MNKPLLLLQLLLVLFSAESYGQSTTINDPNIGLPVCPGATYVYTVQTTNSGNNLNGCAVQWTIGGGGHVFNSTATTFTGNPVAVVWDNVPTTSSNATKLTVSLSNCSNTSLASPNPLNVVVRSLSTTTPTAITVNGSSSGALGQCDASALTLATTRVAFPFPAGTLAAFADRYEWTIPAGWLWPDEAVSTGAARLFNARSVAQPNNIRVTPPPSPTGPGYASGYGTVRVRAQNATVS